MKKLNKEKYNGYIITVWFVSPVGYTFKIRRKGKDVYIGAGENDIYNAPKYALDAAKKMVDKGFNELRICKLHNGEIEIMIRTDAPNDEINTLLDKWKPETEVWDGDMVCKYLNENLSQGKVEDITKKEEV